MVYKNTKGNNYGSYKVKIFKSKETSSLGSRGQTKNLSRRRYLSKLYSRTSGLRKEFI